MQQKTVHPVRKAPIVGLTLHQPWAELIVRGPKRIENRDWELPAYLRGAYLAIHAGKTLHVDAWRGAHDTAQVAGLLESLPLLRPLTAALAAGGTERQINKRCKEIVQAAAPYGAIVGVARIVKCIAGVGAGLGPEPLCADPWFCGPFGFVLEDVVAIDPVPMDGKQGLFSLPTQVYRDVRKNWRVAVGGAE